MVYFFVYSYLWLIFLIVWVILKEIYWLMLCSVGMMGLFYGFFYKKIKFLDKKCVIIV